MAGGSGWQAVQVDGIPPPPVGRADPLPDATGELDDPRLAGHPAQAEQFADRRGSPVRSHYHQAKCTTGKDDLPRRLHRGSRVSAIRTGCETHGRHGVQHAVTPAGDRRQRGSTVTCPCRTRRRAVTKLRTVGPTSNSSPTNLNTTHAFHARRVVHNLRCRILRLVDKLPVTIRSRMRRGHWCLDCRHLPSRTGCPLPPVLPPVTILAVPARIDVAVCAGLLLVR